jgi:hypothetical protein
MLIALHAEIAEFDGEVQWSNSESNEDITGFAKNLLYEAIQIVHRRDIIVHRVLDRGAIGLLILDLHMADLFCHINRRLINNLDFSIGLPMVYARARG